MRFEELASLDNLLSQATDSDRETFVVNAGFVVDVEDSGSWQRVVRFDWEKGERWVEVHVSSVDADTGRVWNDIVNFEHGERFTLRVSRVVEFDTL